MWGPAGGIVFGEELATTGGVEPSFALWAGIGIVGVGVAVAVARRREQRS
jgi:LPXTG-motif cell wall-anchored protein